MAIFFTHRYIYIYIYIYISWKQCTLPVIIYKIYILRSSCFCEIWALCVSGIIYDHLYYAPCLACWALFGSLVPTICTIGLSCAQVHDLPQSDCGNNWEGTSSSWLHICITKSVVQLPPRKDDPCASDVFNGYRKN